MDTKDENAGSAEVESSTIELTNEEAPNAPIQHTNEPKEHEREENRNVRRNEKFRGGGRRPPFRPQNENAGFRERNWEQQQEQGREFNRPNKEQSRNSEYLRERLFEISGPTQDLPHIDMKEKKFSGRNRLYIGNVSNEVTEETLKAMFSEYGEIDEIFINRPKYFAFVIYDYYHNAKMAKQQLDGTVLNEWQIKIRFSPKCSTIKVTNLPPTVTNELLYHAFRIFGEIERAIAYKDDRGRPTGEGEIDFDRKKSAALAVQECTNGCFFLTNSPRPVIAEHYEPFHDIDGFGEKNVQWRNTEFLKDRECGPWFAKPNSFEFEFGTKWKQIRELYKQKEEALKEELRIEEEKLYAQMGFVKYEYETRMLKKQLEERELFWQQQKLQLEEKERHAEQLKLRNEEELRRKEEMIKARLARHEEELTRRQNASSYFASEERHLFQERENEIWGEPKDYWREAVQVQPADDAVSQGERTALLEEPGQVWKRLDDEGFGGNEELFQRRPNANSKNARNTNQQPFKRSWGMENNFKNDFNYGKRRQFQN